MFQNHLLSFGVFYLIFFNNIVLVDRFHCKKLLAIFFLNKQNSAKCTFAQHYLRHKVVNCHFLLGIVSGIECSRGLSHHLLLLLLTLQVALKRKIIMHYILSFDLLYPFLFLFIFGSGKVDQIEFFPIIDGKLSPTAFPGRPQNGKDDLVPPIGGGIPKSNKTDLQSYSSGTCMINSVPILLTVTALTLSISILRLIAVYRERYCWCP